MSAMEENTSSKRPLDDQPVDTSELSKRPKTDDEETEAMPENPTEEAQDMEGLDTVMATKGGNTSSNPQKKKKNRRDERRFPKKKGKGKQHDSTVETRKGTRPERSEIDDATVDQAPKGPRLPKRHCALLVGFCGTGCSGMQIQRDARTIEGVLFEAMVKVGAVSEDNADNPGKVKLGRAARTDAGVHAAGNVVSINMITEVPGVPDIIARINEELPPEIRVWGYVRVQRSFDARVSCDSRKYTYFFPTYLLIPPKPDSKLYEVLQKHWASDALSHSFWADSDAGSPSSVADDLARKRKYRIDSARLESLRTLARSFEGTHNFHNFTIQRSYNDNSSLRFMKSIQISDPAVYGETEWIAVMLHGQSFMLHQIRKMMSALILVARTNSPAQIINEMYTSQRVFIPKMPALGLLLEQPVFGSYSQKIAEANSKLPSPQDEKYREPIDFEVYRDKIDEFKQTHIYQNMRAIEDRDGVFDAWIRNIDSYPGNDLLYLNPKGIIPPEAAIKKGDNREMPFREKKVFDTTDFSKSVKADLDQEANIENNQGDKYATNLDEKVPGSEDEEA